MRNISSRELDLVSAGLVHYVGGYVFGKTVDAALEYSKNYNATGYESGHYGTYGSYGVRFEPSNPEQFY